MANLYLLTQNDHRDYDTFDSIIVCAISEDIARTITPVTRRTWGYTWANSPDTVSVTYLGIADESIRINSVILASFNAG